MVGEIHLANIYFTDGSASKLRPIVLLKPNSFNDIIFLPLTSNTGIQGVAIDNNNLKEGYLPKTSVVVYEKPGVIAARLLVKKIGTLNDATYRQVITELMGYLGT